MKAAVNATLGPALEEEAFGAPLDIVSILKRSAIVAPPEAFAAPGVFTVIGFLIFMVKIIPFNPQRNQYQRDTGVRIGSTLRTKANFARDKKQRTYSAADLERLKTHNEKAHPNGCALSF